jgi:hypothetical protein
MDDEVRAPARATPPPPPPPPPPPGGPGGGHPPPGAPPSPRLPPPPSSRCRTLLCSNERPVRLARLASTVVLVLTAYYAVALVTITGHALVLTGGGQSPGAVLGVGLQALRNPRVVGSSSSSSAASFSEAEAGLPDVSLVDVELKTRNGLLTDLRVTDLYLRIHSAGMSTGLLYGAQAEAEAKKAAAESSWAGGRPGLGATLVTLALPSDLVLPATPGRATLAPPTCSSPPCGGGATASPPTSSSSSTPPLRAALYSGTVSAFLQGCVGLVTGMEVPEGYRAGTGSGFDPSRAADVVLTASAVVSPSALAPLSLIVRGEARLKATDALRYFRTAATGGTGRWSFNSFLSSVGVQRAGSADSFGAFADVAALVGSQTAAVRLPFDLTGDLLAWLAWLRGEGKGTLSTGALVKPASSEGAAAAAAAETSSCCCAGGGGGGGGGRRRELQTSPSSPSSSPVAGGVEEAVVSSPDFPRPLPFTMSFGIAKVNVTGLLSPDAASVGLLLCRTEDGLVNAAEASLLRDLAASIDASLGGTSTRRIRPGTTFVGTATAEDVDLAAGTTATTLSERLSTFQQRLLKPTVYRRADLCGASPVGADGGIASGNGVFGASSTPLRLHAVIGRQGFPDVHGPLDARSQLPTRRATSVELLLATDSQVEVLGAAVRVRPGHVPHLRRAVRELVLGEDPAADDVGGGGPGSPRLRSPKTPRGRAALWRCHTGQIPFGVVAETAADGGQSPSAAYVSPFGGLLDGLIACVMPPWLDAMAAVDGGVRGELNENGTAAASALPATVIAPRLRLYANRTEVEVNGGNSGGSSGGGSSPPPLFAAPLCAAGPQTVRVVSTSLSGTAVGLGATSTVALWSFAGGNGRRSFAGGSPAAYVSPAAAVSNLTRSDPPWLVVRAGLEAGQRTTDDGTTLSVGRDLRVTLTNVSRAAVNGTLAPCTAPSAATARRLSSPISPDTLSAPRHPSPPAPAARRLGASNVPGAGADEDSMGGLLAALASWTLGEVEVDHVDSITLDPLPPYRGRMSWEGDWGAGMGAGMRVARATDPCFQLQNHDVAVMGSCCLNSTGASSSSFGFGSPLPPGSEGGRTVSLSAVAFIAQRTYRSILFRSQGDAQPILLPTLVLRHVRNVSLAQDGTSASASVGVAAVVRSCAVALPPLPPDGSSGSTGGSTMPPTTFTRSRGAFFAAGEVYRLRVRTVVSLTDPALVWGSGSAGTGTGTGAGAGWATRGTDDAVRGVLDLILHGATMLPGETELSASLGDEAATLLRRIVALQYGADDADRLDAAALAPVPLPVGTGLFPESSAGLLTGINWRVAVASYPAAISALREQCVSARGVAPAALTCYPPTSGPVTPAPGLPPTTAAPALPEPLLWRLFSGLSVGLRLPTLRDTAAFVSRGDRAWPQQTDAAVSLGVGGAGAVTTAAGSTAAATAAALAGFSDVLPIPMALSLPALGRNGSSSSSSSTSSSSLRLGSGVLPLLRSVAFFDPPTPLGTGRPMYTPADPRSQDVDADAYNAALTRLAVNVTLDANGSVLSRDIIAPFPWSYAPPPTTATATATAASLCPVSTTLCVPNASSPGPSQPSPFYSSPTLRGGPLQCVYSLPREVCAAWVGGNWSGVRDTVRGGTPTVDAGCAAFLDAACEEWTYPCARVWVERVQDIPAAFLKLPGVDLGQMYASLQVAPECDGGKNGDGDGDRGSECDPATHSSAAADPYALHAGGLSLTVRKTSTSTGWQTLTAEASLSWCPRQSIGTPTTGVFSAGTDVRPLPASRSTLLVALLTRTRLLARAVASHRQLDLSLPLRLFPDATVSAHRAVALRTTDLMAADAGSVDVRVGLLEGSAPFATAAAAAAGTTSMAQPYASVRAHIYADPASGNLYLGLLVLNTLPNPVTVDAVYSPLVAGLVEVEVEVGGAAGGGAAGSRISRAPVLFDTAPPVGGASTASADARSCRLGLRLNPAPVAVSLRGVEGSDVLPSPDADSPPPPSPNATTALLTDGCAPLPYVLRPPSSAFPTPLSLGNDTVASLAAQVGLDPLLLRSGWVGGWARHVSIPLRLAVGRGLENALAAAGVVLASPLSPSVFLAVLARGDDVVASLNASASGGAVRATLRVRPSLLIPAAAAAAAGGGGSGSNASSTYTPRFLRGTGLGERSHRFHLLAGALSVRVFSLPPAFLKLLPAPTGPGKGVERWLLLPASAQNATTAAAAAAAAGPAASAGAGAGAGAGNASATSSCPFLRADGTCLCAVPPSSSGTPASSALPDFTLSVEDAFLDITYESGFFFLILLVADAAAVCFCCGDVFFRNACARIFCCKSAEATKRTELREEEATAEDSGEGEEEETGEVRVVRDGDGDGDGEGASASATPPNPIRRMSHVGTGGPGGQLHIRVPGAAADEGEGRI